MENGLIEFTRGVPPPESFPSEQLAYCSKVVLEKYGSVVLQYANSYGFVPLRERLADQYHVDLNRIIVGQGSLQILDHLLRTHPQETLSIGIEEPSYDRTITIMRREQANILPVSITQNDLDLAGFEKELSDGKRIDYFYVIPDFQNPTGSLLTLQSRKKLIELARSYQFFIIEDSPYRLLRYEGNPIPSFFELEPELVIHMSSFSKLISPGLRVGYMLLPEGLSKQVAKVAEDTYINPSYFNQALVFEYCQEGFLEPQIDYLKNLYKQRRDIMMNALSQKMNGLAHWNKPQGGFFIGCHLIEKMSAENIMQTAITSGIKLTDGRAFYTEGGDTFIRLPRWPVPGRPQKIPVQILSSSALVFGAKTKYSVYGDSLCH